LKGGILEVEAKAHTLFLHALKILLLRIRQIGDKEKHFISI